MSALVGDAGSSEIALLLEEQQLGSVIGVCVSVLQVLDVAELQDAWTVRNAAPDLLFAHTAAPCHTREIRRVHSSMIYVTACSLPRPDYVLLKLCCQDVIDLSVALATEIRVWMRLSPQFLSDSLGRCWNG